MHLKKNNHFKLRKLKINDFAKIAILLSLNLVLAFFESLTWNPITWEINLSLIFLISICSINKVGFNLIFICFFSSLYPFVAYNITQHSIFLHPLSFLLDFFLIFIFVAPIGFINDIKVKKQKNFFRFTFIFLIYLNKLFWHSISGMVIFGSNSFFASLSLNFTYVLVNFFVALIMIPLFLISIEKYNFQSVNDKKW